MSRCQGPHSGGCRSRLETVLAAMTRFRNFIGQVRGHGLVPVALQQAARRLCPLVPVTPRWDRLVARLKFISAHGRTPDTGRKLYNDYLHRLKVTGALEDPLRSFVTDKEYAKLFVQAAAGASYVVPTLAILRREDEVRTFRFPEACAIKATHGSGEVIIRRQGEAVDVEKVVSWLSLSHYRRSGERNYRRLVPKIIVEPLATGPGGDITELYIHCYRGEPRIIRVIVNRFTDPQLHVLDCAWRPTGIAYYGPNADVALPRPGNLPEILRVARVLAAHFESIRVDMYLVGDAIWVGELTNCQSGALLRFDTPDGEARFSALYFGAEAAAEG